jgi:hypothetical protein
MRLGIIIFILAGLPVRGEEPIEALLEGDNSRCGVSGVALNALKADADPRSDAGERDDAMTSSHINLY